MLYKHHKHLSSFRKLLQFVAFLESICMCSTHIDALINIKSLLNIVSDKRKHAFEFDVINYKNISPI